jgi:hypothetical protein
MSLDHRKGGRVGIGETGVVNTGLIEVIAPDVKEIWT